MLLNLFRQTSFVIFKNVNCLNSFEGYCKQNVLRNNVIKTLYLIINHFAGRQTPKIMTESIQKNNTKGLQNLEKYSV